MRDRALHAALRAFTDDAALTLSADVAAGAEVPFELAAEGGRRRTPLYCYRPLTGAFIDDRASRLAALESHTAALRALEAIEDLDAYLRVRGDARPPRGARPRAQAALRAFLERVFAESTDFALAPDRFEQAYAELEATTVATRPATATLVVGLPGLRLATDTVPLAHGVALARAGAVDDAPPDAGWLAAHDGEPNVVAVLTLADAREADGAPERLRRLVRALRLYDTGAVGLAPVGWARRDDDASPWQLVALGGTLPRPGAPLDVAADQEDELRAFVALTARRMPRGGALAWALGRFDLACEREDPRDALTDLLLALRALLEPEGADTAPDPGRLPRRLAALCAVPEERATLAAHVVRAVALERGHVAGHAPPATAVAAAVDELTEHLRALLGDALCGHLDADLAAAADALLAAPAAPA
jgi:hypothetical protein